MYTNADKLTATGTLALRRTLSRLLRLDGALHARTFQSYLSVLLQFG